MTELEYIWDSNPYYKITVHCDARGMYLVEVYDIDANAKLKSEIATTKSAAMGIAYQFVETYGDRKRVF